MPDLAHLTDHLAISQLKARYCRLLDTKDWDGFAALFTEDYELDLTQAGGEVVRGRETVVAMIRSSIGAAATAHHVP